MIGWSNVLQHGARNMEKRFTHFGSQTKMKNKAQASSSKQQAASHKLATIEC